MVFIIYTNDIINRATPAQSKTANRAISSTLRLVDIPTMLAVNPILDYTTMLVCNLLLFFKIRPYLFQTCSSSSIK